MILKAKDRLSALKTALSIYRAELERIERWRLIFAHYAQIDATERQRSLNRVLKQ